MPITLLGDAFLAVALLAAVLIVVLFVTDHLA